MARVTGYDQTFFFYFFWTKMAMALNGVLIYYPLMLAERFVLYISYIFFACEVHTYMTIE